MSIISISYNNRRKSIQELLQQLCESKFANKNIEYDLDMFIKTLTDHNFKIESIDVHTEIDILLELIKKSTLKIIQVFFEFNIHIAKKLTDDKYDDRLTIKFLKCLFESDNKQVIQYFVSMFCDDSNLDCKDWRERLLRSAVEYGKDDQYLEEVIKVFESHTGETFYSYNCSDPSFIKPTDHDQEQTDTDNINCDLPSLFIKSCISNNNPKCLTVFINRVNEQYSNDKSELSVVIPNMFIIALRTNKLSFCDLLLSKQESNKPIKLSNFNVYLPRINDCRWKRILIEGGVNTKLESLIYLHELYSNDRVTINSDFIEDMLNTYMKHGQADLFVYVLSMFPETVSFLKLKKLTTTNIFYHKVCLKAMIQNVELFEEIEGCNVDCDSDSDSDSNEK